MKPILFNTEAVQATLDNRKLCTRRVIRPQPIFDKGFWKMGDARWSDGVTSFTPMPCHSLYNRMPYKPGDILYVRETFFEYKGRYYYKADGKYEALDALTGGSFFKWRPSIHMPMVAARLFLRVTDVRVERLQDITEEQARAEGVFPIMVTTDVEKPDSEKEWHEWLPALPVFIDLWDCTIKKDDLPRYGWAANPWVWVINFEKISKEEALENA